MPSNKLQPKQFTKVVEDFICENCGEEVRGTGYTNHCPKCLWSKHVDKEFPGDRLSECHGLMRPVAVERAGDRWTIVQQCIKCEKISRQKVEFLPDPLPEIFPKN